MIFTGLRGLDGPSVAEQTDLAGSLTVVIVQWAIPLPIRPALKTRHPNFLPPLTGGRLDVHDPFREGNSARRGVANDGRALRNRPGLTSTGREEREALHSFRSYRCAHR
jgi:hypothetical protein